MNFFAFQITAPDVNLWLVLPETIICIAGVLIMLVDAFAKPQQRWVTGGLSLFGLFAAGAASLWLGQVGGSGSQAFNGMIVLDELRLGFTFVFLVVSALTILISIAWVENERLPAGEFHSLLMFATAGMMFMGSAGDLVMVFLGLEILSIATYVMCGFRRSDLRSNESSMKYFVLGSFSSAFLLYGIALVYGATSTAAGLPGTTNIAEIARRIPDAQYPLLLFAGAALMLVGFGFKIATAPFHVWTPDVYEGAPTPVTAFMAAGPKAAGFASFLRVFLIAFPFVVATTNNSITSQLHSSWLGVLTVLAILTMTVGNVVAITQNNVKRMLAYSSIAHAGYALVGFVAAGAATTIDQRNTAIASVIFYLLTYAVMNLGAFAVVQIIGRAGDRRTEVEDYNGIGFQSPWLAFALSLFLLSLLGMPPTAGFMGKVLVFGAALEQHYYALVVIGVLNTAVSAYYYLRLIIVMFFRDRTTVWHAPAVPASVQLALLLTILGVFYLGLFPGRVINSLQTKTGISVSSR
jgi:NADH-quinone oxidoreductase subunit N